MSERLLSAKAVLAAILLVSALLACFWVFENPFFQGPDENAHADYVFAILSNGHLIRARDGHLATDVYPYTQYLEEVSGFRSIRFNPDGRVPPGYGTLAFYHLVDAGKLQFEPATVQGPPRVPYVAALYSFVFYALDALVAQLAAFFTHGSLSAMFFAMRLFCVVLMSVALACSYGILRELHVDRMRALLLTAAIGTLPIVSWHSGYVQPDNLACAVIAASLYLTLVIRRRGLSLGNAVGLGLVLGLVSSLKPPYVVATAIPVLAAIAVVTPRLQSRAQALGAWIALLLPSALILAMSRYYAGSPEFGALLALSKPREGLDPTAPSALRDAAVDVVRAAWSTFGFGRTSTGFWHGFSWTADLIHIGTFETTFVIHGIIVALTLATVALMVVRQARVYQRLRAIAQKKSTATALALLAHDPVLNSYFLFVLLMLALDAFTNHTLSSNRYWVVFILPAFLCGVWYAPRVLGRGGRSVGDTTLGLLLLFSLTSTAFSWGAVRARFYDALPPNAVHYETEVEIDRPREDLPTLRQGMPLEIRGIAFDSTAGLPAHGIRFVLDGRQRITATYGLPEPEFAARAHDDAMLPSGFAASIDTRRLQPGTHTLTVFVIGRLHDDVFPATKSLRFRVIS